MKFILTMAVVFLVLLLVIIIIVFIAYKKISRKIKRTTRDLKRTTGNFAQMAWGTNTISEGVEKMKWEYSTTPKSVAAGTSMYLPRITKDFPDFHYEEMRDRADNVLVSYLRAIDGKEPSLLSEGTQELKEQLEMYIEMLKQRGLNEHFQRIKSHRTEIYRYDKTAGRCTVTFQTAVEYIHYIEENGVLKQGDKTMKEQARYNIELIYIQDRDMVEDTRDFALGVNCPNCGAPVSGLGAKVCEYCGSPIIELNIKAWNFSEIKKV